MIRQEQIREGMEATICTFCAITDCKLEEVCGNCSNLAEGIIKKQDSQGVVIKVERETDEELRERHALEYRQGSTNMTYATWTIARDMFPRELAAVEPLIDTRIIAELESGGTADMTPPSLNEREE